MGNREALLEAARVCLLEQGYAGVSARDLADRSGVSLAAIGYHFGGKEQLLAQATAEALGDELGTWIQAALSPPVATSPADLFASFCAALPSAFESMRPVLLLSLENILRTARKSTGREVMAVASRESTRALGELLRRAHPQLGDEEVDALSKAYFVTINGALPVWIAAPDLLLTADDVHRTLAALAR